MRKRALGPIATLLSLLLVVTTTVQAGPVTVSDVVQVIGKDQSTSRGPELRLRSISLSSNSLVEASAARTSGATVTSGQRSSTGLLDTSTAGAPPTTESLLSGVTLSADDSKGNLDVISQGDLEGSICDCGEIPAVEEGGHGLPKWPLLFLAAIPFFFIHHHCDTCDTTPTPTPTPPGVPEPASLLLMGSGLAAIAARLRRRHARKNGAAQLAATEEA